MEFGKSGSSQQLKRQSKKEQHTEGNDRIKGSNTKIRKLPTLRSWNESIDGRESIGTDSDNNPGGIEQPDDIVYEGHSRFSTEKSDSTSLCASSPPRSSGSDDIIFKVHVNVDFNLTKNSVSSPQVNMDIKPASDKHNNVYMISGSGSSTREREKNSLHPASMSRVSNVSNESSMPRMSPTTQSPPKQVMDRTTPQERRVASTDSTFSVRVGNASFAAEKAVIRDRDKPGEVTKTRELNPQIPQAPTSPKKRGAIQAAAITTENSVKAPPVYQNNGCKSGFIPSNSSNKYKELDGKGDKASLSPVREEKCCCSCFSCSSCSCSLSCCSCPKPKCCWPSCSFKLSCCFKWPSCFRWSNCFKCSWSCCHCWSCCCDSSSDLVDEEASKNSACCCSFPKLSCFSCPFCCCFNPFSCSCSNPSCGGCSCNPFCCSCSNPSCGGCSCNPFCCSFSKPSCGSCSSKLSCGGCSSKPSCGTCSSKPCCCRSCCFPCSKPSCSCCFSKPSCFSCCKSPCSFRCCCCC